MPSIIVETRVEHRLGFGKVGQRDKNTKRQKIKEKCLFGLGWLPQLIMAPCICRVGWSCPSSTHQIYLCKYKLDQICLNWFDRCELVQEFANFQIP
jgi:hypothetical protein